MGDLSEAIARVKATISMSGLVAQAGLAQFQRSGPEWKACCPFHEDRTPSFTIFADDRRWHCHGACGTGGDQIDFVTKFNGVELRDAIARLDASALEPTQPRSQPSKAENIGRAQRIWRESKPITNTPATVYLSEVRGITIAPPPTLRFSRLTYGSRGPLHPCLVALITTPAGKIGGIQRTYLRSGGRGKLTVEKPKLSLGAVRQNAIRLAPADAEMILCEGLEDGLTLQQDLGLPTWVAAGAGMLPSLVLPALCRHVILAIDNDQTSAEFAAATRRVHLAAGREVSIMKPSPRFKDFNAALLGDAA